MVVDSRRHHITATWHVVAAPAARGAVVLSGEVDLEVLVAERVFVVEQLRVEHDQAVGRRGGEVHHGEDSPAKMVVRSWCTLLAKTCKKYGGTIWLDSAKRFV